MDGMAQAVLVEKAAQPGKEDLRLINRQAKAELTADQVYTFAVRLCDNEVDRDFERFPRKSLERLARMFVGKSGIFDHNWSARGQAARLYKTEVMEDPQQLTKAGDPVAWLKGYAYMVKTESNQDLIAEIDGGIKREISVGCAVARESCSICGAVYGSCPHKKGGVYDGKLCFFNLEEPVDAYEWSFVAVPAQPEAGVIKSKHYGGPEGPQVPQAGMDDALRLAEALQEQEEKRYGGM